MRAGFSSRCGRTLVGRETSPKPDAPAGPKDEYGSGSAALEEAPENAFTRPRRRLPVAEPRGLQL